MYKFLINNLKNKLLVNKLILLVFKMVSITLHIRDCFKNVRLIAIMVYIKLPWEILILHAIHNFLTLTKNITPKLGYGGPWLCNLISWWLSEYVHVVLTLVFEWMYNLLWLLNQLLSWFSIWCHDTCTSGASINLLIVCREQLTLGLKILTPNLVSGLLVADG